MSAIDIDYLRQWIGREEVASDVLTPSLVSRFNATFDRQSDTMAGAPAPLLIHWCLCQQPAAQTALGPDGHPSRGTFLPPVPLPNRMWARGQVDFHAALRIGDTVQRRSTVRDVAVKDGRTGPLCFVTVEHVITSGGRHAITEVQDIVYRNAAGATAPAQPPAAAERGEHCYRDRSHPDTPVPLFRTHLQQPSHPLRHALRT